MIDAKDAVKIAMQHMGELFTPEQTPDLTPQEVELSEDEQYWLVTLSFSAPSGQSAIEAMTGQQKVEPKYKQLKLRASDGTVLSMKIRLI